MSRHSSWMNSPACSRIRLAMRRRTFARSLAVMRGQGPSSNAWRAACTAASTSAALPDAASARTSFVVGLSVSNVSPEAPSTKAPPMKCCCVWISVVVTDIDGILYDVLYARHPVQLDDLHPSKIIGVHLNYQGRASERGRVPGEPSYFLKPPSSLA